MANTLRIKRRLAGGAAGAPASLENAELAFNEQDKTLYYGEGTGGVGGSATAIIPIGGTGAFVDKTTNQSIDGVKTFTQSPLIPTATAGTDNTTAASTAFVQAAVAAVSLSDGDYGDITLTSSGGVWTVDPNVITNAKLADVPTATLKGRTTAGSGDPEDLTVAQSRTLLNINNVDNTSDANKPVSTATQTALNAKVNTSAVGAANGVASLDGSGHVPAAQLPSYVDDVLEYANFAGFPGTGETGKIYVALDTNLTYRWSGSAYVEISASPGSTDAVPEGATNLYFTEARARTATVAQTITNGVTTTAPSQDAVFDALVLKANLASPTFTGTPAAPTAATATSTTQLATTAFVQANQALDLKKASNLSDLANVTTARTNLGLGTMAVQNANNVAITGGTMDNVTIDGGTF